MKRKSYEFIHKIFVNRWVKAIRLGIIKVSPIIFIAYFLQIILCMILNVSSNTFIFQNKFEATIELIYSVVRVGLVISISFSLAEKSYKENKDVRPIVVTVAALFVVATLKFSSEYIYGIRAFNVMESMTIIIFSVLSTEILLYLLKRRKKRTKDRANYYKKVNKNYNYIIIPAIITSIICIIIKFNIVIWIYKIETINKQGPLIEVALGQVLWFLGGHGGNIIYSSSNYRQAINMSNLGGAGSILCLIIALYIINRKRERLADLKLPIIASIFNINEPIVYGLPIIFNPLYLIPFILTPIISTYITIAAEKIGFINISNTVEWAMPVFLNGYAMTNSFNGVIVQLVNLIIGILIYMPFVKLSNKVSEIEFKSNFIKLRDLVFSNEISEVKLIERDDDIGDVAKTLAGDLYSDLMNKEGIYLEYQPQVSKSGAVVGVEALLRWKHKTLGNIPPNITILIASEIEINRELGKYIINEACYELSILKEELNRDIEMSINVSSDQLKDSELYSYIVEIANKHKIDFSNIKLEITEIEPLGYDEVVQGQMNKLSDLGIKFAIDDFGQGYNPILYLLTYNIDTVKLDGSLIRKIDTNNESKHIVSTMFDLCRRLDIKIVCEFVENESQRLILDDMGDGIYQGYLFSKPLGRKEVAEYIRKRPSDYIN